MTDYDEVLNPLRKEIEALDEKIKIASVIETHMLWAVGAFTLGFVTALCIVAPSSKQVLCEELMNRHATTAADTLHYMREGCPMPKVKGPS